MSKVKTKTKTSILMEIMWELDLSMNWKLDT